MEEELSKIYNEHKDKKAVNYIFEIKIEEYQKKL